MFAREKIEEIAGLFRQLAQDGRCVARLHQAADWVNSAFRAGNKVLLCGNGGSAADAQHVAGELVSRFYQDRAALPAVALTTDTSVLTAIANDYAFDQVFCRQVEALGRPGDVLIGISTSGRSRNVLRAFETARSRQLRTILLTGAAGGTSPSCSDLVIAVPATDTPRVQEMLLALEHVLCQLVEQAVTGGV